MKKYLLPIIVSLLIVASSVVAVTKIMPYQGGTGQDSSGWTGFVKVTGGTWGTATVDISDDTNLGVSGTLLQLSGDTLSIKEGTLTSGKLCKYDSTSGLVCNYDDQDTTYSAGTGLDLTGTTFSLSHLGLESLTDPNANRLYYWNDTNNTTEWLDYSNWDTDKTDDLTTATTFSGDVSGAYNNLTIGDDKVTEADLKIDNSPADEYCLTYEASTGNFEWQSCAEGSGSGDVTDVGDCTGGACFTADGGGNNLYFEGTTADAYEVKLTAEDPGTDYTLTLPAFTGYIVADATKVTDLEGTGLSISSGVLNWSSSGLTWQGNPIDISDYTNLAVGGTLLNLTDDTLSVNEGTLTDGKLCKYVAGTGLDCNYDDQDTTYTAGRSLTLTGTQFDADAELYTDTKCIYIEDPTADDDLKSIWRSTIPITFTKVWAESDQTVTFNLQEDDGSPANILSSDLTVNAGENSTADFADANFAAESELDLVISSVSNTPTWVSICFTYTKND